ncbi:bucentaur or craniofacial development-domain-containing protein [Absidia repens]|uniref:SWR1-complex protein 5 n=1 Tax=Absidia repens TaxID=90262 RepID=A0A1X2IXR7_9FUNG|nr:bucentaur or craniofacial development-domain-containing protein [Absidia repens]
MSKSAKPIDEDIWSSDEDDSDFVPEGDQEDDHNISDADNQVEEVEITRRTKRTLDNSEDSDTKRTKSETERKAKVDALWEEMNAKSTKQTKPLDDISPSVNQLTESTSTSPTSSAATSTSPTSDETANKPASSSSSSSFSPTSQKKSSVPASTKRIQRPKSNLSDLVSKYNIKVPKINTLEKSRLDWQGYVEREGIKDDLKYTNKDGYMEKVAFLQRVDDRRWSDLKQGQKQSKK